MMNITIRKYDSSDAAPIVNLINQDEYNLQKGMTIQEFERYLDDPGARSRDHTFVAVSHEQIIGYSVIKNSLGLIFLI
ncbi:hypothetical protein LOZ80_10540 [Paenibacillus sp. HWE-109]|uniref:hypothetical protein n=1 Tax=Paenibacillus sp. HWE-109 TaxID=1306526 RepID=UPI001EDC9B96|nr:hypothetical protein [Paenibacillus sp. HWE-109]UKS29337.1 hypothetical protein LOZ80_10540 [Paenibacillus sp. HWE-109]